MIAHYDSSTNEVVWLAVNQAKSASQTPLTVINDSFPTYDQSTHKLSSEWVLDINAMTYTLVYTVLEKTQYDLDIEAWKYPQWDKKLVVNASVLFTAQGVIYRSYLQDKGYEIETDEFGNYHIWIDAIFPAHQAYVTQLETEGLLTIFDKPTLPVEE